jgi:fructose-bisphosphate aldolase class I
MDIQALAETAQALVADGKGVLAADESLSTIEKRFRRIDLPSTPDNRQAYREMLFTAPGVGEYISGVILFDETIRQSSRDGVPFPELLRQQGIIPGIKVDTGAKPLALFEGEKITEGLDGLRDRLLEYRGMGARFTKWRAVISIGEGLPTATCLASNAEALARFAALSQECGLVPIVEPEVLMDGDHAMEHCAEVTTRTLATVFPRLLQHRVAFDGMLLKPNMVVPGAESPQEAHADDVARMTLHVLRQTVPAAVPGIVFLSGGQHDEWATRHLQAMNAIGGAPWELSFSFARALQMPALLAWGGKEENVRKAQQAFLHRARMNSLARNGRYVPEQERKAA